MTFAKFLEQYASSTDNGVPVLSKQTSAILQEASKVMNSMANALSSAGVIVNSTGHLDKTHFEMLDWWDEEAIYALIKYEHLSALYKTTTDK